jgi:hypothetical protein
MTTEQYSIGYEEGYQTGWNDAMESLPAQRNPLPPEWYAQWIRNNYQNYWNIATLCDEMTKAAHGSKEKNT